jgi:DNA (cytosine-5)-methyltransferase 1
MHETFSVPSELLTIPTAHPTLRDAISDLVDEPSASTDIFRTPSRPTPRNRQRMDYLFDNRLYDLPNTERPECHRNGHSYKSMYGRLKWHQPAQTITTGFGCMGQGRFVHPSRRRTLTPHEAARIQGFPDFFSFSTVKHRVGLHEMIGNAVPPPLASAIVRALIYQRLLGVNVNAAEAA